MRIVAGDFRSRPLRAPSSGRTRPTSDKVRGAVFNVLASLFTKTGRGWEDFSAVLDLYAGSGALGLEALSRGVPRAVFVESDRDAQRTILDNIRTLGVEDRSVLEPLRVVQYLRKAPPNGVLLVFADPPYTGTDYGELLALTGSSVSIPPGSVVVIEHPQKQPPDAGAAAGRLVPVSTHAWGDTGVTVYEVKPGEGVTP